MERLYCETGMSAGVVIYNLKILVLLTMSHLREDRAT